MEKNDGGPAFPRPIGERSPEHGEMYRRFNQPQDGMTLRQWYAGMALAVIAPSLETLDSEAIARKRGLDVVVAQAAFRFADAMIAHEEDERKADRHGSQQPE